MKKYFENIWLGIYTVLLGMKVTLTHLFSKKYTNQYPDRWHPIKEQFWGKRSWFKGDPKHGDMPPIARNRLYVDPDLCNGCRGCERACPVNCITVETIKATPGDDIPPLKDGSKRSLWVAKHEIDFAKCCYCDLCTEPCPTDSIYMVPDFEYSTEDRDDLIVTFISMTEEQKKEKEEMYKKHQAEKKKQKEAEKKAKAKEGEGKPAAKGKPGEGKPKPAAKKQDSGEEKPKPKPKSDEDGGDKDSGTENKDSNE